MIRVLATQNKVGSSFSIFWSTVVVVFLSVCRDQGFPLSLPCYSKHLMTGPSGDSEFCFPETLNVPQGEAEGNIEGLGETKLTVSRGASH